MAQLTVTVDYHSADDLPPGPVWIASDVSGIYDVWGLMWRSGSTVALKSVRSLRTYFCETRLQGEEFDYAVALYMSQTLGCLPLASQSHQNAA